MSVTAKASIIPSNPSDKAAIFDAVKEADASLTRIAAEKDQVAKIIEDLSEKYEINKGVLRKLISVYHKQNFNKVEQEFEDFTSFYENIIK